METVRFVLSPRMSWSVLAGVALGAVAVGMGRPGSACDCIDVLEERAELLLESVAVDGEDSPAERVAWPDSATLRLDGGGDPEKLNFAGPEPQVRLALDRVEEGA